MSVFGTGDFHSEVFKVRKQGDAELEHQGVDGTVINRCWVVVICLHEVDDIRGKSCAGRSLKPLLKRACEAILTRDVSGSCHRMFWMVHGTHPRKMPRQEFGQTQMWCQQCLQSAVK